MLLLPIGAHDFVVRKPGLSQDCGYYFVSCARLVERDNQRLNDRSCTLPGANVAPAFQVVGFWYVPMTSFRGLIEIEAVMDSQRNTRKLLCEIKIGRSAVAGIGAEYHECID